MLFGAAANEPETNPIDEETPNPTRESLRSRLHTPITESVSDETAEQIITRQQKKLERIMTEKRNSRKVLRRAVVTIASVLAFVGVITALNVSGVAEFHRPDSGITTGLGPASSSIAVVNNSVDIVSSSTVLINRGDDSILAGVAEVGDGSLVVFDETGQFTVAREDVQGRVLFVLPFLGYFGG
jgi:hypothetical protein